MSSKIASRCLTVAGVATAGMGLYHFFLPTMFHWDHFLDAVPAPVHWGAIFLNLSFSALLVWGGALTVLVARRRRDRIARAIVIGLGGYWLFNAIYQIASPLPVPSELAYVDWLLLGFASAVTALYAIALAIDLRPATSD